MDGSHSDAPSWKKSSEEGGRMDVIKKGEEDEVTSPLKAKYNNTPLSGEQGKGVQKRLTFSTILLLLSGPRLRTMWILYWQMMAVLQLQECKHRELL